MTVKFTAKGNVEEIKALFNALNSSKACKSVRTEMLHKDRELTTGLQTFVVEMTPAKRYSERAEKPLSRERAGYVYLHETPYPDTYKMGKAIDTARRKKQLELVVPFGLKLIHSFWSQDAYAAENDLKKAFQKHKKRIENSEFYVLSEYEVARFCALG